MPLHVAQPPVDALDVATAALARVRRLQPPSLPAINGTDDADLALAVPHPVFVLSRDEVAKERPLEGVRQTRWRYLVLSGERAVGGIEVEVNPSSGRSVFAQADEGWIASSTIEAIRTVESLPEIRDRTLEVRLLIVPELYVVALWLKDANNEKALLVPLARAPKRFEPFHPYQPQDFLSLLRAEAEAHPAFDSSPQVAVPAD